jgi:ectoine hydroxylase-related dioxygenase (phytanoyl-CoA dioxygenase family)
MMPHRHHPVFLNALRNPRIVTMMEQFCGGRVVGLQTEFFYCKPGTRGFSMHQDNFFVQAPTGAFASAWCALTDTHREKGGLIAWPGSHREGELPVRKIEVSRDAGQDPNANNEESELPPGYAPLHASVPKGAAFYIHGHLVHASNPNLTDEWRYVLLMTYVREGVPFRPGKYANREPVNVYG